MDRKSHTWTERESLRVHYFWIAHGILFRISFTRWRNDPLLILCRLFNHVCFHLLNKGGIGAYYKPQNRRKKSSKTEKPKKKSIKTENRMQNCQNRYIFTSQLLKPWSIRYSGDKWSIQSKLH